MFLDTETDGLERSAHLCEVAIVDGAGKVLIDSLVRYEVPLALPAWSALSGARFSEAPSLDEVLRRVAQVVGGKEVWSFNASFDRRILWSEFQRRELQAPRCRWHCAATLVHTLCGTRLTLAQAAARFGIQRCEPAHRALPDARTLRRLVQKAAMEA